MEKEREGEDEPSGSHVGHENRVSSENGVVLDVIREISRCVAFGSSFVSLENQTPERKRKRTRSVDAFDFEVADGKLLIGLKENIPEGSFDGGRRKIVGSHKVLLDLVHLFPVVRSL